MFRIFFKENSSQCQVILSNLSKYDPTVKAEPSKDFLKKTPVLKNSCNYQVATREGTIRNLGALSRRVVAEYCDLMDVFRESVTPMSDLRASKGVWNSSGPMDKDEVDGRRRLMKHSMLL